jgi:hypothetical protein
MLQVVAIASRDPHVPLVPFWPLAGAACNGELLAIGRSVNGWVEDWTAGQLRDESTRRRASEFLRADAEPRGGCRMVWVTDRWGARPATTRHARRSGACCGASSSPTRRVKSTQTSGRVAWSGKTCTRCRQRWAGSRVAIWSARSALGELHASGESVGGARDLDGTRVVDDFVLPRERDAPEGGSFNGEVPAVAT